MKETCPDGRGEIFHASRKLREFVASEHNELAETPTARVLQKRRTFHRLGTDSGKGRIRFVGVVLSRLVSESGDALSNTSSLKDDLHLR
jgi:hypothetical protein